MAEKRIEFGNKEDAFEIRRIVYMDEQGFENEFEEIDETALHVTFYVDGKLLGCARSFPNPDIEGGWIFGRLAVIKDARGQGYATDILKATEAEILKKGGTRIDLHAQCYIEDFYKHQGYESYGEIELDEGVEHVWMRKKL